MSQLCKDFYSMFVNQLACAGYIRVPVRIRLGVCILILPVARYGDITNLGEPQS